MPHKTSVFSQPSEPYQLNTHAPAASLKRALMHRLMRADSLVQLGVNELLMESGACSSQTVHYFSNLAEIIAQARELCEVSMLKDSKEDAVR